MNADGNAIATERSPSLGSIHRLQLSIAAMVKSTDHPNDGIKIIDQILLRTQHN